MEATVGLTDSVVGPPVEATVLVEDVEAVVGSCTLEVLWVLAVL